MPQRTVEPSPSPRAHRRREVFACRAFRLADGTITDGLRLLALCAAHRQW